MGCGGSKVDRLPIVTRCRDRKRLIRAAKAERYRLAAAHRDYFRSLRSAGEALRRFADEQLVTGVEDEGGDTSPVLTIPSSDGKPRRNPAADVGSGSGHLLLSSESDDSHIVISDGEFEKAAGGMNFHYMRAGGSEVPTMVYDPPPEYYVGEGRRPEPSPPSPPRDDYFSWLNLNPFPSYDAGFGYGYGPDPGFGYYYGYNYGHTRFGSGSERSSSDSGEVREKEGIPDLEDDTDTDAYEEVEDDRVPNLGGEGSNLKGKDVETVKIFDRGEGSGVVKEEVKAEVEVEVEVEDGEKRKGVSFEVGGSSGGSYSLESLRTSSLSTLSSSLESRDIREVVEELREQFAAASEIGKEIDALLEVDKVQHRPKNPIFAVVSCRSCDVVCSVSTSGSGNNKLSGHFDLSYVGEDVDNRPSLSLTLEKLYAWEKKLHKEIRDEEKLRISFQKQRERLKTLDDRGAEPSKIDATQELLMKLESKLAVTITTVAAISKRIHSLREEELQPQVIDLFNGFMRMWTGITRCHRKQLQAIMGCKRSSLIRKTMIRRDSSSRATWELERELRRWCVCFDKWIGTHKAYVKALNDWLRQCLLHEPERTPDGILPFSPGRIGAPPIFVVTNDWCGVLQRTSEVEVTNAIHNFANTVHKLWESQGEERKQKLKADYLSRDFEIKLKSVPIDRDSLDNSGKSLSNPENNIPYLEMLKRRLEEEKAKHKVSMKQVHEAVSGSIEMGLFPIFEAMDKFSRDVVKGLEGVRTRGNE